MSGDVHKIDASLCAADFKQLMELAAIKDFDDLFSEEVNACSEYDDVVPDCSVPGLPGIETQLQIKLSMQSSGVPVPQPGIRKLYTEEGLLMLTGAVVYMKDTALCKLVAMFPNYKIS